MLGHLQLVGAGIHSLRKGMQALHQDMHICPVSKFQGHKPSRSPVRQGFKNRSGSSPSAARRLRILKDGMKKIKFGQNREKSLILGDFSRFCCFF